MGTRREAASAAGRLVFALALLALVSTSVCGTAGALKGVRRAAELQGAARRVTADGSVVVGIVDGAMRLRGGGKKDKAEAKEEAEDGDEKMEDKEPVPRSAMDMPEVQDPNEYEPVPLPHHFTYLWELEAHFNELPRYMEEFEEGMQSDFANVQNLAGMLRLPADFNTSSVSSARVLTAWATLKMKIRGNFTSAESLFQKALSLDPKYVPALVNYANMLFFRVKDRADDAEDLYKKALQLTPHDSNVLNNYALFLQEARKDDEGALEHFKKAYQHDPKHQTASYHYGKLLGKINGDKEEAARLRAVASKNDPNKRWPGLKNALFKHQHSKGIEVLYKCPDRKCVHNVQNEATATRSCIKGLWCSSGSRAKYTPKVKEREGKWSHYPKPLYDSVKRAAIHKEHEILPGIQIPHQYYTGGRRPARPLAYRGVSGVPAS